jgi:hypothetical protein
MAKSAYQVVYEEMERDLRSKDYGYLVRRTKRFAKFNDAVQYCRVVANTNFNVVGSPTVEEV